MSREDCEITSPTCSSEFHKQNKSNCNNHIPAKSVWDVQVGGKHYKNLKIQPTQYIEANKMPFSEGCIVKYVTRHENKNGLEDIKKIVNYCCIIAERYGCYDLLAAFQQETGTQTKELG